MSGKGRKRPRPDEKWCGAKCDAKVVDTCHVSILVVQRKRRGLEAGVNRTTGWFADWLALTLGGEEAVASLIAEYVDLGREWLPWTQPSKDPNFEKMCMQARKRQSLLQLSLRTTSSTEHFRLFTSALPGLRVFRSDPPWGSSQELKTTSWTPRTLLKLGSAAAVRATVLREAEIGWFQTQYPTGVKFGFFLARWMGGRTRLVGLRFPASFNLTFVRGCHHLDEVSANDSLCSTQWPNSEWDERYQILYVHIPDVVNGLAVSVKATEYEVAMIHPVTGAAIVFRRTVGWTSDANYENAPIDPQKVMRWPFVVDYEQAQNIIRDDMEDRPFRERLQNLRNLIST